MQSSSISPPWTRGWLVLLAVVYGAFIVGCGTVPTRTPVPQELSETAMIPGIPMAKTWGDEAPPYADAWFAMSQAELEARYPGIMGKEHTYLAISGGGQNGAYSVGLLLGWTDAGTRPEFTMVTGVSTGALVGPFAFLGPEYDPQLKEIYTGITTKDVLTQRRLLTGLTSDALASTEPLQELIKKYITPEVMDALAVEFRKGRQLNVGTTNLDAGRPVIWNITRIAASGHPHALELIHQILLASASIPVAFPPVLIEVEADGQRYDEMHVDGGGASQVFLYPIGVDWQRVKEKLNVKGTPSAYLIRNARLSADWKTTEARLAPIAGRTIGSLIRTQGIGDMYRVYLATKRDGVAYRLAYIPDTFQEKPNEPFDREYMRKLFDVGYRLAKDGYPWVKNPPGAVVR
ncbi:MAG: patatin-like phospholipase family protein [Nitrospiraceae bacterium]